MLGPPGAGAAPGRGGLPAAQLALDYLMGVAYNLALLRHWGRHAFLFFLDADEFVLLPGGASSAGRLSDLVATTPVVTFPRVEVLCTDCPPGAGRDSLARARHCRRPPPAARPPPLLFRPAGFCFCCC